MATTGSWKLAIDTEFEVAAYGELAKPPQLLSSPTARFETRRLRRGGSQHAP